jgi:hypothetical protein
MEVGIDNIQELFEGIDLHPGNLPNEYPMYQKCCFMIN